MNAKRMMELSYKMRDNEYLLDQVIEYKTHLKETYDEIIKYLVNPIEDIKKIATLYLNILLIQNKSIRENVREVEEHIFCVAFATEYMLEDLGLIPISSHPYDILTLITEITDNSLFPQK